MKVTKGAAGWVGIGAALAAGAGFFFNFVVARGLGPAGTGVVLSFATWFTILLTLGKLGTDTAVVRTGARAVAGATALAPSRFLWWSLQLVIPTAVVLGIGLWIAAPQASHVLASDNDANLVAIVRLGAVLLPFAIVGFVVLAMLRGVGQIVPFVAVEQIIKPLLRVVFAVGFLFFGVTSIFAYSTAWAMPAFIGFLITALVAAKYSGLWLTKDDADGPTRRVGRSELWRFAGPRGLAQGVDIVNASIGVVVLAIASTAFQTGLFGTAVRIVLAGQLAFQAVRILISPVIAHRFALHDIAGVQSVYSSANSLVVAISWPLYLLLLGAAVPVLSLFGSGFDDAATILRILVLVSMVVALLGTMQNVVLMAGASGRALLATTVGLTANLVITIALVPSLNGTGAAIGWGVGALVEAGILVVVMRGMGLHPATGTTLILALRTVVVLGVGAGAFMVVGSDWVLGCAAYLLALAIWALWCRRPILRAWHELTDSGQQEVLEVADESITGA